MEDIALGQKAQLALTVLEMLSPIFAILVGWATTKLASLISTKVKNEKFAGMLMRFEESVLTLVHEAEQTAVKEIKASKVKESDGGAFITKAEGENIKRAVRDKFKAMWGYSGLQELGKVLGLQGPDAINTAIDAKIESAVHGLKLSKN